MYNSDEFSWYSDLSVLASSDGAWFQRGGLNDEDLTAGVFSSVNDDGSNSRYYSTRLIITP